MANFNVKNISKEFKRTSMDSDTSGYSTVSTKSSVVIVHNYQTLNEPSVEVIKVEKEIKRKSILLTSFSDHIETLKECNDQEDIVIETSTHLHMNEVNNEEKIVDNGDVVQLQFSPLITRRKSLALEQEEKDKNAPRRSRRLSTYVEVIKEQKNSKKRKLDSPEEPQILQFPKIMKSSDHVVKFKTSREIKNRRKSHGDISNVSSLNRKQISRRKSLYIAHDHQIVTQRPRRKSTFVDKTTENIKKPERKSTDIRGRNNVTKKLKEDQEKISTEIVIIPPIEEEVIEDVWFVSLITIEKESQMRFLVKWDGHPPSANTYEPFEHIEHCDVLQEFVDRKFNQYSDEIQKVHKQLLMDIKDKFNSYENRSKNTIVKKICDFNELEFKCSLLAYIFTYGGEVLAPFMKKLKQNNLIYRYYKLWKEEQDKNFMLLETIMSEENYSFELTAENNIDFEPIPKFKYLSKVNFPLSTIVIDGVNPHPGLFSKLNQIANFKTGCECSPMCNKFTNCCPQKSGWNFVFDESLKLNTKDVQMIIECSDFCSCDKSCPNRPKEITIKMAIFKTKDRGWSVKTLQGIAAGKFVVEYTGEFLDQQESRKRVKNNTEKNTYLFDLDYIDQKTPYSIDATYEGNIARFINHSCKPNLQTWPATACHQNPRMHKLYYFSKRFIFPGEEL